MSLKSKLGPMLPDRGIHVFWRLLRHFPIPMIRILGDYLGLVVAEERDQSQAHDARAAKVLIIHGLEPESRQTTVDYVSAFMGSSRGIELTVANVFGFMPEWLGEIEFDLAVVTTEALSHRTTPFWPSLEKRIVAATRSSRRKVLMPQDDYTDSAKLDSLAVKVGVQTIYSPLIKGLETIYPRAIRTGVEFVEALTGYYDQEKVALRTQMGLPFHERSIDIGQRVRKLPPQFGEIGYRKYEIAEVLATEGRMRGLSVDFSSEPEDVLLGEDWFKFLGNTKFTVSCRGGSSIIDTHGKIAARLADLKKYLPKLSEDKAFKIASVGQLKTGDFDAVSPRLFDAAMMGVCQILLEDDYMGMQPWVHYIPLKRDYSNLEEVLHAMEKPGLAEKIVENARAFLLDPSRFSYTSLVERMLDKELSVKCSTQGTSTLQDVDALLASIEGETLKESFSRISGMARSRLRAGLKGFDLKYVDDGVQTFRLRSSREAVVYANWLSSFFRRPAFPEILIVRWCPLSWFFEEAEVA